MAQGKSKVEVISFRELVTHGTTVNLSQLIQDSGTIQEMRVRFYAGQEKALHVVPYILHTSNRREDLITYAPNSDTFLSGENDYFVYPIVTQVENLDKICVSATNIDPTYDYTLVLDLVVDYYGGTSRVIGGAING